MEIHQIIVLTIYGLYVQIVTLKQITSQERIVKNNLLGNGVMVAQRSLKPLVVVRAHAPQPILASVWKDTQ